MKNLLALTIGGTTINVPQQIQNLVDPTKFGGFGEIFIGGIIFILFIIAIIMAFGFIIFGGFKWITSQGDPKQVEGARNTIIYAVVGLGIVFLSFFAVNVISCFLKVPLLGNGVCQ